MAAAALDAPRHHRVLLRVRPRRYFHLVLLTSAVVALVTAAALVAYLENRAAELQREQTHVIVQQICERTATALAARIRTLLDAALFETIEGIGHPQMLAYDLPRIAAYFAEGYKQYPYVDRFFIWAEGRSPLAEDQVVFHSPGSENDPAPPLTTIRGADGAFLGSLVAEPALGRAVLRLARERADARTFVVLEETIGGVPYQIVIHPLWSSDRRLGFAGLVGYTVNLQTVDGELFRTLLNSEVATFLNPDPRLPTLAATLLDEKGRVVYGKSVPAGVPSGTAPLDMLFFPYEPLHQWLGGRPPVRLWQVSVSAAGPIVYSHFPGKWVVGAVVLLIVIAVLCALSVERQALRLSQMQADFVANASHQLKTPLSLLSTAVETLSLDRVPPERMKEYLQIVRSQTRRMTTLVERILQFARVEAGPTVYRMEPLNVVPLVHAVVDRFRADNQARVPIAFESSRDVVMARVDANAIEQAVVNLLDNAVKYGDDHNAITVAVRQSNGYAAISVRDEGFGIHSSDVPHVFNKFYRGRTGGDGRPGFGLGLAVVDSVARAHGGRATLETIYKRGSEFNILLPVLPATRDGLPNPRH
jgi:signal transduction histidine kinase